MTKEFFTKRTLDQVFQGAMLEPNSGIGDRRLAALQREMICEQFAPFRYDSATVNAVKVDSCYRVSELSSLCFQVDDRLATEYQDVVEFDPFSPATAINPGRIISANFSNLGNSEDWEPYWLHAKNFDIAGGAMMSYRQPGHDRSLLGIEYHQAPGNLTIAALDFGALEQATFPFALAWMARKNMLDAAYLKRCFMLLEGLSPLELHRLRKYINSPRENVAQQAEKLGIGFRRHKDSLYRIKDKVSSRLSKPPSAEAFRSLRPIDFDYSFLRMMGDPTQELISAPVFHGQSRL